MLFFAFIVASFICSVVSHTATEWESRIIYQVLTDRFSGDNSGSSSSKCGDLSKYCGGTYSGIEAKLDYITGMGFDAIWISPMLRNTGNDYHGYAYDDLYALNSHFGTEAQLKSLISAAHSRDVWIMLDVVANHVAPVDLSFNLINPFNESKYYHSKCDINDWNNQNEVETCRLANLPDLDQDNAFVRSTLIDWVSTLKAKYNFDGLRIDTIPEVKGDFWSEFSKASGMYCVGEVFNGDINYVSNYQNYVDGVLSYPLYFTMRDVFASRQSMYKLESLLGPSGSYAQKFKNTKLLGTFIDNHDNSRFLNSQSSWTLYKNAIALTLFTTGIPIIYYGTEQGYSGGADPANRESLWPNYNTNHELYQFVSTLVKTSKSQKVSSLTQIQRYASENFYAFTRGDVLVCTTNAGESSSVSVSITYLPYSNGQVVCNVLNTSDCLTVSGGALKVVMTSGLPKVYVSK